MFTTLPSGRRGQLLALTITVVALLVVWAGVVAPLVTAYSDRAFRLNQKIQLAARLEALAGQLPALRARVKAAGGDAPPPVTAIAGTSDAVAEATLQNMVREMANQPSISVTSIENAEAQASAPGYRRIGIRLTLNASWPSLVSLLQAIRQSRLPMLIDDLQIHAPQLVSANASPILTAEVTVYAFREVAASETKP